MNFWPLIEGQKSKIWAQKNINRGDLKNIVGQLSIDPSSGRNIDVSFEFDGGAVQLPEKFPPIENVSAIEEILISSSIPPVLQISGFIISAALF